MDKLISQQAAIDTLKELTANGTNKGMVFGEDAVHRIEMLPSVQPERKAVFNRDIAIEEICDEVMLWFDISATKAYEIAETAVKRIEVRMEKRGEME